jgi:DNA-binding transcriptional LysR family regulator
MLDRYLLRYFLAVVDQGNFSRAAALCNVSQPTLSVGVAKLGGQVGAPLFLRSSQRVELTAAGARFLVHARRIESEYNLAERVLAEAEPVRRLRIGWLLSISTERLAAAVAGAEPDEDGMQVEIIEGNERDLQGHLARGRIDLAVSLVRPGETRFAEEPIVAEGYRLALPAGHRLAGAQSVAAEALAAETMIVRRHCEGLGLTVMPESYRRAGIAWPQLAGFDLQREIGFVFAPHGERAQLADLPLLARIRAGLAAGSLISA